MLIFDKVDCTASVRRIVAGLSLFTEPSRPELRIPTEAALTRVAVAGVKQMRATFDRESPGRKLASCEKIS